MEWDLLVGPMCRPMLILTLVPPIRCGHGGVVGEVAGAEAGDVASAGAGLGRTGIHGGKSKVSFLNSGWFVCSWLLFAMIKAKRMIGPGPSK